MNPASLVVFVVFALLQLGVYIAVRRWLYPLPVLGAVGVFASILLMALFSLLQANPPLYAVLFGIVVGGLFSITVLTIAILFRRNTGTSADTAYLQQHVHPMPTDDDLTPGSATTAAIVGGEDAE